MEGGEVDSYTHQNRQAWNEVAQARQRKMRPSEFFADGGHNFGARELATLGDVRGLSVLHAPCASGEDTLSFAVLGARPTGLDISDGAITIAKDKAERAGLGARFVCADLLAPPPDLQDSTFDLVYASAGALAWLPDIGRWAKIVADALRPGGRLILCEHHPFFFDTLDVSSGRVEIGGDYFGRGTPKRDEGGLGHLACGAETTEHYYVFTWPLGDVVTAVIQAGMRLERLEEFPYEDSEYHTDLSEEFRAELRRLPVEFHLVARKE